MTAPENQNENETSETQDIALIRDNWTAARRDLDGRTSGYRCSVGSCTTMPFVTLKTSLGPRDLCLVHFEQLKATPAV